MIMALSITLPLVISVEPADIFVAERHSLTCAHAGQEAGHPGSPQPHSSEMAVNYACVSENPVHDLRRYLPFR